MTVAAVAGELEVRMVDASPTMFGAPRWVPDRKYDVVFVGVPSDVGGLGHRSPAAAPDFLRGVSAMFPIKRGEDGRSVGWFDYVQGRTLLRGIEMADAGNFPCRREAGLAQLEPLSAVYATLRETAKQLVILGGDHSISYFLARSLDREAVVWVDAHEDASPVRGTFPDCANVVSYVERAEHVPLIAQFGLRGIVPDTRARPPAKRKLCATPAQVVAALHESSVRSAALSIDVDVLDPSILPAVGSAMPEGLRPADVLELVGALSAAGIALPVIELAEFAPTSEHDVTSALVLVNLLLRMLALCPPGANVAE